MQKKRFRLFLILLFVSIILMTLQNRTGPIRPFRFLAYPLHSISDFYVSTTAWLTDTLKKYDMRDEELRELNLELRGMKLKEQRYTELLLESQRLKELLQMKKDLSGYVATARVVGGGSDPWARALVINMGASDGIEKNMAVMTPEGLLGKVQHVDSSYSTVLLLDDSRFSAAVRLQTSRAEGVFTGSGRNRAILKYVGSETTVAQGEAVVTSGLDELFPAGIPVGFVTRVVSEKEALFHIIAVTPYADTRKVEEVILIRRR